VNNQNLICLRYFGRKSNNPNKSVLIAIKLIAIAGKALPYSLSMVLPDETYSNKVTSSPKIIYP
jgi:phage tail protein X